MSDIAAAIAGLIGGLVGTGGTLTAARLTARDALKRLEIEHNEDRARLQIEARRQACITFVGKVSDLETASWALADQLALKVPGDMPHTVYRKSVERRNGLLGAYSELAVFFPQKISDSAVALTNATVALHGIARDWYYVAVADTARVRRRWAAFDAQWGVVEGHFAEFIQLVSQVYGEGVVADRPRAPAPGEVELTETNGVDK
ncbi:hypothetical protein [Catenulispora pinisilvae]|uniref:hypothetical protein n=1 Tax=Catenulispora pinisilvae TaxID=2705253 RepID=UPI001892108B|nr:hypothetical protein [Catenulispora pinisilvae]